MFIFKFYFLLNSVIPQTALQHMKIIFSNSLKDWLDRQLIHSTWPPRRGKPSPLHLARQSSKSHWTWRLLTDKEQSKGGSPISAMNGWIAKYREILKIPFIWKCEHYRLSASPPQKSNPLPWIFSKDTASHQFFFLKSLRNQYSIRRRPFSSK